MQPWRWLLLMKRTTCSFLLLLLVGLLAGFGVILVFRSPNDSAEDLQRRLEHVRPVEGVHVSSTFTAGRCGSDSSDKTGPRIEAVYSSDHATSEEMIDAARRAALSNGWHEERAILYDREAVHVFSDSHLTRWLAIYSPAERSASVRLRIEGSIRCGLIR